MRHRESVSIPEGWKPSRSAGVVTRPARAFFKAGLGILGDWAISLSYPCPLSVSVQCLYLLPVYHWEGRQGDKKIPENFPGKETKKRRLGGVVGDNKILPLDEQDGVL